MHTDTYSMHALIHLKFMRGKQTWQQAGQVLSWNVLVAGFMCSACVPLDMASMAS